MNKRLIVNKPTIATVFSKKKIIFLLLWLVPVSMAALWLTRPAASSSLPQVGQYQTLELAFTADETLVNPFDTYLLKLEITDPSGRAFTIDGFYDGDGHGGQTGQVWKARITPYMLGIWSWRTVPADNGVMDSGLAGLSGQFEAVTSGDTGGVVANGQYFRFQRGEPVYLVGNFLDFANGLRTTHTFMSETTSDDQRNAILARQNDFHAVNKANIYFANKGDYDAQSVTPWLGSSSSNDKTRMDLARWQSYDNHILRFKDSQILAELWFFADDSNFGSLSEAERNRLFRYAMARTSAFSHVMYVVALEWQEGFNVPTVNDAGNFIHAHNPWQRLVSVHSVQVANWDYAGQNWATFIASQAGNRATADIVNDYSMQMRDSDAIPHLGEEFGMLRSDSDSRLRGNLWATFTAGAAGSGTGSDLKALQRFIAQSYLPFQRMAPANALVESGGSTRFVLAEIGHHYVVYSSGGAFKLDVAGSGLTGQWFNPRDPNGNLGGSFDVAPGNQLFTPPSDVDMDWVLWISDDSNLNSGVTHLTGASSLITISVSPGAPDTPPTATATPLNTLEPTPLPTEPPPTAMPTNTPAPQPTNMPPNPTNTPAPLPTETPPPSLPTETPVPSACDSRTVLYVGRSTPLSAAEQALVDYLTALGHIVVVSDQRTARVGDAAGKDLIIVAPGARRVGDQFRDVTVPVIVMEVRLFSLMYLTGRRGDFGYMDNQSQVVVIDNTHPMAAGLSDTVMTHSVPDRFYWGQPGAEAVRVAVSADPNKVLIFAYETGASLARSKAPARRVAFYNGSGTGYTVQGWLLFRAAVEWSLNCS